MKSYYRVMLGKGSLHAQAAFLGNFIGVDYLPDRNLTDQLPEDWRAFNEKFIPIYLSGKPDKTRIAAGLACGMLWTVAKGIKIGDIVLCPDGSGVYHLGEVVGEYLYCPGDVLPHRRSVRWLPKQISKIEMSDALRHTAGPGGTLVTLTNYGEEIERLISPGLVPPIVATDASIEDPSAFAMEKHLEDFMIVNWSHIDIGKKYEIYKEDGEIVGQQYQTDTGPIDILAISKDKKTLLVIELKRGRATDVVVGQILRYMGYVKDELAEPDQDVRGIIIAMENDKGIRRALSAVPNVDFYRYEVTFKLIKD